MDKYEYKVLEDTEVYNYCMEDINALGSEGWRVVWTIVSDNGNERTLFERISKESPVEASPEK